MQTCHSCVGLARWIGFAFFDVTSRRASNKRKLPAHDNESDVCLVECRYFYLALHFSGSTRERPAGFEVRVTKEKRGKPRFSHDTDHNQTEASMSEKFGGNAGSILKEVMTPFNSQWNDWES